MHRVPVFLFSPHQVIPGPTFRTLRTSQCEIHTHPKQGTGTHPPAHQVQDRILQEFSRWTAPEEEPRNRRKRGKRGRFRGLEALVQRCLGKLLPQQQLDGEQEEANKDGCFGVCLVCCRWVPFVSLHPRRERNVPCCFLLECF